MERWWRFLKFVFIKVDSGDWVRLFELEFGNIVNKLILVW